MYKDELMQFLVRTSTDPAWWPAIPDNHRVLAGDFSNVIWMRPIPEFMYDIVDLSCDNHYLIGKDYKIENSVPTSFKNQHRHGNFASKWMDELSHKVSASTRYDNSKPWEKDRHRNIDRDSGNWKAMEEVRKDVENKIRRHWPDAQVSTFDIVWCVFYNWKLRFQLLGVFFLHNRENKRMMIPVRYSHIRSVQGNGHLANRPDAAGDYQTSEEKIRCYIPHNDYIASFSARGYLWHATQPEFFKSLMKRGLEPGGVGVGRPQTNLSLDDPLDPDEQNIRRMMFESEGSVNEHQVEKMKIMVKQQRSKIGRQGDEVKAGLTPGARAGGEMHLCMKIMDLKEAGIDIWVSPAGAVIIFEVIWWTLFWRVWWGKTLSTRICVFDRTKTGLAVDIEASEEKAKYNKIYRHQLFVIGDNRKEDNWRPMPVSEKAPYWCSKNLRQAWTSAVTANNKPTGRNWYGGMTTTCTQLEMWNGEMCGATNRSGQNHCADCFAEMVYSVWARPDYDEWRKQDPATQKMTPPPEVLVSIGAMHRLNIGTQTINQMRARNNPLLSPAVSSQPPPFEVADAPILISLLDELRRVGPKHFGQVLNKKRLLQLAKDQFQLASSKRRNLEGGMLACAPIGPDGSEGSSIHTVPVEMPYFTREAADPRGRQTGYAVQDVSQPWLPTVPTASFTVERWKSETDEKRRQKEMWKQMHDPARPMNSRDRQLVADAARDAREVLETVREYYESKNMDVNDQETAGEMTDLGYQILMNKAAQYEEGISEAGGSIVQSTAGDGPEGSSPPLTTAQRKQKVLEQIDGLRAQMEAEKQRRL